MSRCVAFFLLLLQGHACLAASDSLRTSHWGAEVQIIPGKAIVMDRYQRKWQRGRDNVALGAEMHYSPLPADSDAFAFDYNYPIISLGLRYHLNRGVTMHRSPDEAWGLAEEVDYDSRLGNSVSLYASFTRPFFRTGKWMADYTFSFGTAYSKEKYNITDGIDNELIGSRWLIYFGAALHLTYRLTDQWGLRAGWEYYHHSNGALNRPNKGANFTGPMLGVVYMPYYQDVLDRRACIPSHGFKPYCYLNITAAVGCKTLDEDWKKTQFSTPPDAPDYRTDEFRRYAAYALSADFMYRYQRRWASGLGVDAFYGTYAPHVERLDKAAGHNMPHSPFSLGIAAKHEVFWHQWSLSMALGWYLYRHMGYGASQIETPYYERIGIHYTFARLKGLQLGVNVKAHKTKADLTEVSLGVPFRLGKP